MLHADREQGVAGTTMEHGARSRGPILSGLMDDGQFSEAQDDHPGGVLHNALQ